MGSQQPTALTDGLGAAAPPAGATGGAGALHRMGEAQAAAVAAAVAAVFDSPSPPVNPIPIPFLFSEDMERVGAWVAGRSGTSITLRVYDNLNVLLDSVTIGAGPVANWNQDNHFIGLEAPGIRRAVFSGEDFGLDALTFETPIPEPGSAGLLAFGLLLLMGLGRRTL